MRRGLVEALRRNGHTDVKASPIPKHWPLTVTLPQDGEATWWSATDSPRVHVYTANGRPFRVTLDRDWRPVTYAVPTSPGSWVGRWSVNGDV